MSGCKGIRGLAHKDIRVLGHIFYQPFSITFWVLGELESVS